MPTKCKHCGDKVEAKICEHCNASLLHMRQCYACHLEMVHDRIVPDTIDVRDPKTSFVDDAPRVSRPTKGFDKPTSVHEGKSGQSLADGWAMLDGYENDRDKYDNNRT